MTIACIDKALRAPKRSLQKSGSEPTTKQYAAEVAETKKITLTKRIQPFVANDNILNLSKIITFPGTIDQTDEAEIVSRPAKKIPNPQALRSLIIRMR